MKFRLTALSAAACLLIAACDERAHQQAASAEALKSLLNSPKVTTPDARITAVNPKPLSQADTSVSPSEYVDLNAEPGGQGLTYLVLAKAPEATSTEQKLGWLSPGYLATTDGFKRQDIEKAEWPGIEAKLNRYAANSYYSLPIKGFDVTDGMGMQNISVGPYDFASSSFPISSYGQYCWSNPVRNEAGMNLKVEPSQVPCSLEITDQAQARVIEHVRAEGTLEMRGTLYLFVPKSTGSTAVGEVVHGVIELRDRKSAKVLETFHI
jgi:hypothetical protein